MQTRVLSVVVLPVVLLLAALLALVPWAPTAAAPLVEATNVAQGQELLFDEQLYLNWVLDDRPYDAPPQVRVGAVNCMWIPPWPQPAA